MVSHAFILRLYSELEANSPSAIYDLWESSEDDQPIHRAITLGSLSEKMLEKMTDPNAKITLLIPTEHTKEVKLGALKGSTSKVAQAAPYLTEELIATDLPSNHAVVSIDARSRDVTVVMAQHNAMQEWLSALSSLGIVPHAIYRDTDTIDRVDVPKILVTENRAVVVRQESTAAISVTNLPMLLASFSNQDEMTDSPILRPSTTPQNTQSTASVGLSNPVIEQNEHWFPTQYRNTEALINLAQAPYSSGQSNLGLQRYHWIAITVLFVAIGLQIITYYGLGAYYNVIISAERDQQTALYRDLFPQEKKLINIRAQLNNHIKALDTQDEYDTFAALLYLTLDELKTTTDLAQSGLRSLHYQNSPSRLNLEVAFQSVQELDQLEEKLAGHELETAMESITQEGESFVGKVTVTHRCVQC